jgi:hypothetical protein
MEKIYGKIQSPYFNQTSYPCVYLNKLLTWINKGQWKHITSFSSTCAVSNPTITDISLVDISFQVLTAVGAQIVASWFDTVSYCMNSLIDISFQVLTRVGIHTWPCVVLHVDSNVSEEFVVFVGCEPYWNPLHWQIHYFKTARNLLKGRYVGSQGIEWML